MQERQSSLRGQRALYENFKPSVIIGVNRKRSPPQTPCRCGAVELHDSERGREIKKKIFCH